MATQLTGNGLSGSFNTSGVSSPFALDPVLASVPLLSVLATFSASAAGSIALTASTDGGLTYKALKIGPSLTASRSKSGLLRTVGKFDGTLYRLEATVSSGSIAYSIGQVQADSPSVNPARATGNLSGVGVSASFSPLPGELLYWDIEPSKNSSMTVKRSTDGGSTWSERTDATRGNATQTNTTIATGLGINYSETQAGVLYRVECTQGSGSYTVTSTMFPDMAIAEADLSAYCGIFPSLGATQAQIQGLYNQQFTNLSDADIAGTLTIYKACRANRFAKLSVPSGALRRKGTCFAVGKYREISAQYADVISVFDGSGATVSSAVSIFDPSTTYAAGQRVTATDVSGNSSGAFGDVANFVGIRGFLTLAEAVANGVIYSDTPKQSLTALGL